MNGFNYWVYAYHPEHGELEEGFRNFVPALELYNKLKLDKGHEVIELNLNTNLLRQEYNKNESKQ